MRSRTGLKPPWRARRAESLRPQSQPRPATETDALVSARSGDLASWTSIVRQHQELVFRTAYLVTRDSAMAEETTKVAFVRAHRTLRSLEAGSDLGPWLMRLTDAAARRQLRETHQRRDARAPEPDPCPRVASTPVTMPPGAPALTPLEQRALVESFEGLMTSDRVAIASHFVFGLDRDAAANVLGVEATTMDQRLATSLAVLRRRTVETMTRSATPDPDPLSRQLPAAAGRIAALPDALLGSMVMAAVFSELPWFPDVVPSVHARLARDAAAYPATPTMVAGSTRPPGRHARPTSHDDGSHQAPGRRGPSALRSVGLVAGFALVAASVAVSTGAASEHGWEMPADVQARIAALFGEPGADPTPAATSGAPHESRAVIDRAASATQTATDSPTAVVSDPAPDSVASKTVSSHPDVSVVGVRRLADGSINAVVRVDWPSGTEPGIDRVRLERRAGKGRWAALAWTDAGEARLAVVKPDRPYRFRVRAIDAAGDEVVSEVSHVRLSVRGSRSERVTLSPGDWGARRGPSGGRQLVALAPGATVRTEFSGSDVALVGRLGPSQDPIGIRIDGGSWLHDPAAGERLGRSVLFSEDLEDGRHSLDVRASADGLTVDAILILRTPSA
jgi:DNA-directed RNA polymerase specialized sigma24 family protein